MVRRVRFLLLLIFPLFLIPLLPTATAQADGESSCAAALAAATSRATRWQGYKIVRAPQQGGAGADVVLGTSGNDDLRGGAGNDLVCGFDGNDVLRGGPANDTLVGGPGADTLSGESGDDSLNGGPGADTLNGDSGDDRFWADAQDVVVGGPGESRTIRVTPTATPVTPTATPITPTATPVTPTATPVTPTATPVTPTATPVTPTVEPVPEGQCWYLDQFDNTWEDYGELSYSQCRESDNCPNGGACYKWTKDKDTQYPGWP